MYRRMPFFIYIAVFILTWPAHFAVRGIPKTRNELCLERGYDVACTVRSYRWPCHLLTCGYRHRTSYAYDELIQIRGVPDFTDCGESKVCMNGRCVDVNGTMPQYRTEVRTVPCQKVYRKRDKPVLTRREQCKKYGFDVACEADDNQASLECDVLKCGYVGPNGFYFWRSPEKLPIPVKPIYGTWCGHNKACRRNQCVSLSDWPNQHPTFTRPEVFDICCPEIDN